MSKVFETDEHAYRACILYEVVHGKSVTEAYENVKKVKPNVEYSDFEYWFNRFSGGNHDLTLGFSDIPLKVVDIIVGNLGLEDKLSTRKVCRNMRAVFDNQEAKFGVVGLTINENSCEISYEDLTINYYAEENGNYRLKTPRKTISLKGDYWIMALEEFASVITHPKWSFEFVSIAFDKENPHPENERRSILFLNSLLSNHEIQVDSLSIDAHSFEPLAILLPHFKADSLFLNIFSPLVNIQENLVGAIVRMARWKNLTKYYIIHLPDGFPIEALFQARESIVRSVKLTEDRLMKIRDILFKTSTFDSFVFHDEKDENREEHTVLVDRVMGAHAAYDPETKVYRIENSNDHIQISIKGNGGDRHRSVYIESSAYIERNRS